MSRPIIPAVTFLLTITAFATSVVIGYDDSLADVFSKAEGRFQPPSPTWFEQSQSALQEEVVRVGELLEAEGEDYARAWKSHLRWSLLEVNLGALAEVNLDELRLVRRWFYSNCKGLESQLFEPLRTRLDAYLDAVFALQHPSLQSAFDEKLTLVRNQCRAVDQDPSDVWTEALGRTLGWFEQTGQLADEIATVRNRVSSSNIELIVSAELVSRVTHLLKRDVTESMPVSDTMQVPGSGRRQRERTMQLTGVATSTGQVGVGLAPNNDAIEFLLGFQGRVHANCRAITGPVALTLVTSGTVDVRKSVYLSPSGFELGETTVIPRVTGRITEVDGRGNLAQRIGTRRSSQPEMQALTNRRAREKTRDRMKRAFDERVDDALEKMQTNANQTLESLSGFAELLAPVVREGAVPVLDSVTSPNAGIAVRVTSARRSQLAAIQPCPSYFTQADVQARVHVSFFNNTTETMLGGKRLADEFFMKYAEILHEELPLPLMVHSRTSRWAVRASSRRPIELQTTGVNELQFRLRFDALEIDGEEYEGETTCSMNYNLERDQMGGVRLHRQQDVQLESRLPKPQAEFLHSKVAAFFTPVLDGSGILIPSGGTLGLLNEIESVGLIASDGWLIAAWNIPDSIFEKLVPSRRNLTPADSSSSQLASR